MDWKLILQIVGVGLGLVYLWLEYKANIWLWVVGLVMPVVHGVLYYQSGLYADASMNVYYVLAGIYGLAVWRGWLRKRGLPKSDDGSKVQAMLPISHTPLKLIVPLAGVAVGVFALIAFILIRFTDSTVPLLDAATTALSVVAMWMLSRKFVEQWLVWLVVDLVSCGLYIYKDIPFTAGLYGLYSILAVAGFIRWKRQILGKI